MKRIFGLVFFGVFFLVIVNYIFLFTRKPQGEYIDFNKIDSEQMNYVIPKDIINIGIISVSGGNKGYVAEKELTNYIGKKLNKKVKLVQRRSYKEINTLLKNKEIDIAFLSTGAYALYEDKNSLELIARPNRGKAYYHPTVIVKSDSNLFSMDDIRGKDFAFVDTYSYSGYLFMSDYLKKQGMTVNKFFDGKYYFTYSHEESIRQVASGGVKAAIIDDWALQYLEKNNPELIKDIKVLKVFEEIATGPVVTHKDYDDKEKLKEILFNINKDTSIQDVLDRLQIEKYEKTEKEDYPHLIDEVNNVK